VVDITQQLKCQKNLTDQIPSLSVYPIMYCDGLMWPSSIATIGGSGKNGFGDSGSGIELHLKKDFTLCFSKLAFWSVMGNLNNKWQS